MWQIFTRCSLFRNYGKMPAKQAGTQPWDMLCIDLIGKYRMTPNKGGRKYVMKSKKDKDK